MSAGSRPTWSRRGVLLLVPIIGLAGCSEMLADSDSYIPTMKKDPMFSWRPSMKASRSVSYSPSQNPIGSRGFSTITIEFLPAEVSATAALLKEAYYEMTRVGYVNGERPAGTQDGRAYSFQCQPYEHTDHTGIFLDLIGFVWK